MFVEKVDHKTGERQWIVADDDYDCAQELARSRFGDMILDYDRNDKFLAGLKTIIAEKKAKGEPADVLDIGTGTGLLSLMAAREGADKVTALEVFAPMAKCAETITSSSEWKDKISVISSRSTDLDHLERKPNIIVAEVFDTELIGEGALRTFKEALNNLTSDDCRVVPSNGRVWIQPVASDFLNNFNRIPTFGGGDPPPSLLSCPGTSAVFDVQLSQLDSSQFTKLSEPFIAFTFDFEHSDKIIYDESFVRSFTAVNSGPVDAVLMWWDIDMDGTGKHFIDMAPSWINTKDYAWRDHWMQAVYYLPVQSSVTKGQTYSIRCSHDEFSLWFSMGDEEVKRPYCSCEFHTIMTRQSMYRINQLMSNKPFVEEVERISCNKNVCALGEGSLIGLLAAGSAKSVVIVEKNHRFRKIINKYISHYGLKNVELVASMEDMKEKPDVVIAEPFYLSAMNPWQNLRFCHEVDQLRQTFGDDFDVYPQKATLYGVCEQFDHLQKIAQPVGAVNGFDLGEFDKISWQARQATDAIVDEQSLWEYSGKILSQKQPILTFDLKKCPEEVNSSVGMDIPKGTNGIPLWMEWHFGDAIISTGLIKEQIDHEAAWAVGHKQGVYFLSPKQLQQHKVTLKAGFSQGDVNFQFI